MTVKPNEVIIIRKEDIAAVTSCRLFGGINTERASDLCKIIAPYTQSYSKGAAIFSPDSFSRALAVILSGSADVTKSSGSGTVYMSRLAKGDIFGMASLFFESEEYLTSVTAREKCRILFFSRENVMQLFELEPSAVINYVTILSERIHFLNERIAEIGCPDAKEKLYEYLSAYREKCGETELQLPCSLSALASSLSLGRTSLYRAFDALEDEGKIRKSGKTVIMIK